MAAGNRAYEERFGRIFLIRAAGPQPSRDPRRAAAPARSSDDDEVAEVADQLRQIALLRLRTLFEESR